VPGRPSGGFPSAGPDSASVCLDRWRRLPRHPPRAGPRGLRSRSVGAAIPISPEGKAPGGGRGHREDPHETARRASTERGGAKGWVIPEAGSRRLQGEWPLGISA